MPPLIVQWSASLSHSLLDPPLVLDAFRKREMSSTFRQKPRPWTLTYDVRQSYRRSANSLASQSLNLRNSRHYQVDEKSFQRCRVPYKKWWTLNKPLHKPKKTSDSNVICTLEEVVIVKVSNKQSPAISKVTTTRNKKNTLHLHWHSLDMSDWRQPATSKGVYFNWILSWLL